MALDFAIFPADKMMKYIAAALVLLLFSGYDVCADSLIPCKLYIGSNAVQSSSYLIVIPNAPTVQERFAADELADFIYQITGEKLETISDTQQTAKHRIIVGKCPIIAQLGIDIDYAGLGDDGIVIAKAGPDLVLTGNKRGVLYAVYTFLDRYAGIKWLAPDCTVLPSGKTIRIDSLNLKYVPPFATRSLDYFSAFDQDWAARNKVNGYGYAKRSSIDQQHGGEVAYPSPYYFWHTIRQWIPFDKYRDSHPEYFSEINGTRITTNDLETDFCMTNPEVVGLVIDGIRKTLREHPESEMIGVSQNDHSDRYCRCKNCSALVEKHKNPSALIVNLVNQAAAAIEEEFPKVKLTMLAYHWSQTPPVDMPVHKNVVVEICPLGMNQAYPIEKTKTAYIDKLKSDLAGWSRLCSAGQVKMCNYSINYARLYQPHPNLYIFKPNMEYFVKNGAGHFYDCGSYSSTASEFADLRAYLIAKLAWDPSQSTGKLIDEFVNGYYGRAAGPIRKYIDLIHRYASGVYDLQMDCYATLENGQFSESILEKAKSLFDEAEMLAGNDSVLRDRVQIARLPVLFSEIDLAANSYFQRGGSLVSELGAKQEQIDRFVSVLNKHNITRMTDIDYTSVKDWADGIYRQINRPALQIVTLENNACKLIVIPGAGGRIWKLQYKKAGKDVLGIWGNNQDKAVYGRGYEEYLDNSKRPLYSEAEYKVLQTSDRSVTMEAVLPNGIRNTRTISLNRNAAIVTISNTYKNTSQAAIKAYACIRPAINTSSNRNAYIEVLEGDKVARRERMTSKPGSYGHWLKPSGCWRLVDTTSGIMITQTYDQRAIDQCAVWYRNLHPDICTFELLFKPRDIGPGEYFSFTHTYSIDSVNKDQALTGDNIGI